VDVPEDGGHDRVLVASSVGVRSKSWDVQPIDAAEIVVEDRPAGRPMQLAEVPLDMLMIA
jgi:hypothetical protein